MARDPSQKFAVRGKEPEGKIASVKSTAPAGASTPSTKQPVPDPVGSCTGRSPKSSKAKERGEEKKKKTTSSNTVSSSGDPMPVNNTGKENADGVTRNASMSSREQGRNERKAENKTSSNAASLSSANTMTVKQTAGNYIEKEEDLESQEADSALLTSLLHQAWPPLRVEEQDNTFSNRWNDREVAHWGYGLLFLGFLAASIYTLIASYSAENIMFSSEFKVEPFKFPIVTICGNGYSGRTHDIQEYGCDFSIFSHPDNPHDQPQEEDAYKDMECKTKLVSALNESYNFHMIYDGEMDDSVFWKGDCVVYNYEAKQMTHRWGYVSMDIHWDAVLSEPSEDFVYCDGCPPRQSPKDYVLILSDSDPSEPGSSAFGTMWKTIAIPESGITTFVIGLIIQEYTNDVDNVYKVQDLNHIPWASDNHNDPNRTADPTLTFVSIGSSEEGVLHLTKEPPTITVVLGSIWGLFGFITAIFYIFFGPHPKRRNALVGVSNLKASVLKNKEKLQQSLPNLPNLP
jgi:hypothetical protein